MQQTRFNASRDAETAVLETIVERSYYGAEAVQRYHDYVLFREQEGSPDIHSLGPADIPGLIEDVKRFLSTSREAGHQVTQGRVTPDFQQTAPSAPATTGNPWGLTPLMQAAQRGDVRELENCIKAGDDINESDSRGWTALMVAVTQGNEEAVRLLMEQGADCYEPNHRGVNAIQLAEVHGRKQMLTNSSQSPPVPGREPA